MRKKSYIIQKKHISLKNWIYTIVICAGLINIFFPYVVHADLFGFEVQDVYAEITNEVIDTNDLLNKAFKFTQVNPYGIINNIDGTPKQIAINVRNASKTVALVVATLLLMVDFFRKTINFEWSSKWENILIFLIKIIVIKQVVQNADVIIVKIYSMFNYINKSAIGSEDIKFLPDGNLVTYSVREKQSFVEQARKGWWDFWYDKGAGAVYNNFTYKISKDAVKMFYPNAEFPSSTTLDNGGFKAPTSGIVFTPIKELAFWQPYFLVMKAIAYIIFVITIGRVFELCIYIIMAPLPLATFASETSNDVAKSFIKNFIAVVIQVAVIVVMFIVYYGLTKYVGGLTEYKTTKLFQLVILIALGLSVTRSCAWAKKICGIA